MIMWTGIRSRITYRMKKNRHTVIPAKMKKLQDPIELCILGNVMPTKKLPPQLAILPKAIALDLGPTSNSSEPTK